MVAVVEPRAHRPGPGIAQHCDAELGRRWPCLDNELSGFGREDLREAVRVRMARRELRIMIRARAGPFHVAARERRYLPRPPRVARCCAVLVRLLVIGSQLLRRAGIVGPGSAARVCQRHAERRAASFRNVNGLEARIARRVAHLVPHP